MKKSIINKILEFKKNKINFSVIYLLKEKSWIMKLKNLKVQLLIHLKED